MKDDVKIIKAKAPKRGTIVKDLPKTGKEFAKPAVSVADPKVVRKISRMRGEEQKIPEVILYQEDTEAPSKKYETYTEEEGFTRGVTPRYISVEERKAEEYIKKKGMKGTEMELLKHKLLTAGEKAKQAEHITEMARDVKSLGREIRHLKHEKEVDEGEGTALQKINKMARLLRDEDPALTHKEAQKLASARYKEKKSSSESEAPKRKAVMKEPLEFLPSSSSEKAKPVPLPPRRKPKVAPAPVVSSTDTEGILERKGLSKLGSDSEKEFKRVSKLGGARLMLEFNAMFPRARKERTEVQMRHELLKGMGLWHRRPAELEKVVKMERMFKKAEKDKK
jgi:hypothetical protein